MPLPNIIEKAIKRYDQKKGLWRSFWAGDHAEVAAIKNLREEDLSNVGRILQCFPKDFIDQSVSMVKVDKAKPNDPRLHDRIIYEKVKGNKELLRVYCAVLQAMLSNIYLDEIWCRSLPSSQGLVLNVPIRVFDYLTSPGNLVDKCLIFQYIHQKAPALLTAENIRVVNEKTVDADWIKRFAKAGCLTQKVMNAVAGLQEALLISESNNFYFFYKKRFRTIFDILDQHIPSLLTEEIVLHCLTVYGQKRDTRDVVENLPFITDMFLYLEQNAPYLLTVKNVKDIITFAKKNPEESEKRFMMRALVKEEQLVTQVTLEIVMEVSVLTENEKINVLIDEMQSLLGGEELREYFRQFVALCARVNDRAEKYQQRDLTTFLIKHWLVIKQIIHIMGERGIKYLHSLVAATVLTLERTLYNTPLFNKDLQDILAKYWLSANPHSQASNLSSYQSEQMMQRIMVLLSVLSKAGKKIKNMLDLSFEKSLNDYLKILMTNLLQAMFKTSQRALSNAEINQIFQRFEPDELVKLMKAKQNISRYNDLYQTMYEQLLQLDCLGQAEETDNFLHNSQQTTIAQSVLVEHNQKIRKNLKNYQMDVSTVLSYNATLDFSVTLEHASQAVDDANKAFQTLWSYIVKLDEAMKILPQTEEPLFKKLAEFMKKLQQALHLKIGNNSQEPMDVIFQEKTVREGLGEINVLLKTIEEKSMTSSPEFEEYSGHVRSQYTLIKRVKEEKKKVGQCYSFQVKQWDKSDAKTFFLGDQVGCCLATDSTRFYAMIQRRMDDATLFHVVIDKKTQTPVALLWLYLAVTQKNEIVLVSNFSEVSTKYGENRVLRLALLNGLLQFTHQYCQAAGITRFYMTKPDYGWNKEDFCVYDEESVQLQDKLGGAYGIVNDTPEKKRRATIQHYFLRSLDEQQFYRFDPKHLTPVVMLPAQTSRVSGKTIATAVAIIAQSSGRYTPSDLKKIVQNSESEQSHENSSLQLIDFP